MFKLSNIDMTKTFAFDPHFILTDERKSEIESLFADLARRHPNGYGRETKTLEEVLVFLDDLSTNTGIPHQDLLTFFVNKSVEIATGLLKWLPDMPFCEPPEALEIFEKLSRTHTYSTVMVVYSDIETTKAAIEKQAKDTGIYLDELASAYVCILEVMQEALPLMYGAT